ncbi:GvpL/GvpF family gas vesicle protein [Jatrophihabitans sp.]|uniref:GvpL/GvpF family gas vesicle protein n=1 Tax=Jatrophihabitans sp. TaxID=1932789 RepID=UPI002CCA22DA|nr:GvpL/GvpF family gas vesicle protein [Jatrophihabitans sp.]
MTTGTGYYIYAIGDAEALAELDGIPGIDDTAVVPVTHGQLSALTSVVHLDSFSTVQQATAVTETSWLAHAVRAHERVALQALDRGPVLPMRFGTVYARGADVQDMLRRRHAALLAELHRLAGATEWSLKVRIEQSTDQPAEAPSAAGSGTAWLLARQAALQARSQRTDRLTECVEQVRAELAPQVRDIAVSRPLDGATDTVRIWLLADDAERLAAALEPVRARWSPAGCTLELTGPWPPYHFLRGDALEPVTTPTGQPEVRP